MSKEALKPVILDATDQPYGRLAAKVASLLNGKDLVSYSPAEAVNRQVIIQNISKIKIPTHTSFQKKYYRHSKYPGSLKETTFDDKIKKDLKGTFRKSVKLMLPKNRLTEPRIKHLTFNDEK